MVEQAIVLQKGPSTFADALGRFTIGPVGTGEVVLDANTPDGRLGETRVDVRDSDVDGVLIELADGGSVTGRVVDPDSTPLSSASVALTWAGVGPARSDSAPTSEQTAEDGTFEILGLRRGDYRVHVTDAHGEALSLVDSDVGKVEIREPSTSVGDLVVTPNALAIAGVVRHAETDDDVWLSALRLTGREERLIATIAGVPLSGWAEADRDPVLVDEDGRFRIDALAPGSYKLEATTAAGAYASTVVSAGSECELELQRPASVSGVVRVEGTAVPTYVVELQGPEERSHTAHSPSGEFELDELRPGTYDVSISAAQGSLSTQISLEPGGESHLEFELVAYATVVGTLKYDSAPARCEPLMIRTSEGFSPGTSRWVDGTAATDDQGRFQFRVPPGAWVVECSRPVGPPRHVADLEASPGETVDVGAVDIGVE